MSIYMFTENYIEGHCVFSVWGQVSPQSRRLCSDNVKGRHSYETEFGGVIPGKFLETACNILHSRSF